MHIQPDRALVPAGSPATRYLAITIAAPPAPPPAEGQRQRPGVNVSLVLDRSGSMAGRKFGLARQAVVHAIRLLKETDQLGVVVYDHEVETVVERTAATARVRQEAQRALARIEARGSTNLGDGWSAGARSLDGTVAPDRVTRVLLLTDGLVNQGVTDHDALTAMAAEWRARGVSTSTFGLGADFDEDLLTAMATQGGGHFYFIERPEQIADVFASELGEVLDVVARDVAFEVRAEGPAPVLLNGRPVDQDGPVTRVRLGELVSGQELTLLLAVPCPVLAEGQTHTVECRVVDRDGGLVPAPMSVTWTAVATEADAAQPVNHEVLVAVAEMLAERARERALAANKADDFAAADRTIDDGIDRIRQIGLDDERIAAIVQRLLDEKGDFTVAMEPLARKARHFAAYEVAYSREGGRARKKGLPLS